MNPPKRSSEPRRVDDWMLRALAGKSLTKILLSVLGGSGITILVAVWTASAWTTNLSRTNQAQSDSIHTVAQDQAELHVLFTTQLESDARVMARIDSLIIVLTDRERHR